MRRFLPILIVVVGLAALAVDFLPLDRPLSDPPAPIDTRLGLDLQGGLRGEYRALPTDGAPSPPRRWRRSATIIENRINQYGVAEPIVQTQGSDRIVVEIPGVTNESGRARPDRLHRPARLRRGAAGTRAPKSLPGSAHPAGPGRSSFSGDQIASAQRRASTRPIVRAVNFTLTDEGARSSTTTRADHVGEQFAIVLDGIVQSAPSINGPITGGKGQITGGFTRRPKSTTSSRC